MRALFATSAILLISGCNATPATPPAAKPAELKVLDRLVGAWGSPEASIKNPMRGRWVLGGTRVQIEHAIDPPKYETMMLIAWDKDKAVYRGWWFTSTGDSLESTGTWDDQSETLAFTSELADESTVTRSYKATGQKLEFVEEAKDKTGKSVSKYECPYTRGTD